MSKSKPAHNRILSIYPSSRGFGYVLVEGMDLLVDWGVVETKYDKHRQCLARIERFVRQYRPNVIVSEDAQKNPHRGKRIRKLLAAIRQLVLRKKIKHKGISRAQVQKYFHSSRRITKHQMAVAIAERFPELSSRLPPRRKPWMSEDSRMAIFDAAALLLTGSAERGR
jgi:hypothetical protein